MFERSGLDAARLDEGVDLVLLEPDDPAEAVRGELALINEPIQRPRRHA